MTTSVFIDTNILIDNLQHREGWEGAEKVLSMGKNRTFRMCMSSLTIANVAYIMRKVCDKTLMRHVIEDWLKYFVILPDNDMGILHAIRSDHPDFEDALQLACAENELCDAIITRNKKHFEPYTDIPVFTPEELIAKISS